MEQDDGTREQTYRNALVRSVKAKLAAGGYDPAPEVLADRMISRAFFDHLDRFPDTPERTAEP